MDALPFTYNIREHLLIGFLQGTWVYLFLTLIGPFDTYELDFWWRAELMLGYGIIFILAAWLIIPWQRRWYRNWKGWGWPQEILAMVLVFALAFIPVYLYYKSPVVEGEYTFHFFFTRVYIPATFILAPFMIAIRRFMLQGKASLKEADVFTKDKITLRGNYQKDVLHIYWEDLVAIKSASNYVEVFYLQAGVLQKKLLRTSMQQIETSFPALVRTHRSYLINPQHFVAWKDRKLLLLTQLEVPVSESYRLAVEERFLIRP